MQVWLELVQAAYVWLVYIKERERERETETVGKREDEMLNTFI